MKASIINSVFIAAIVVATPIASAQEGPSYLYFKNNSPSTVFVWVNGEPQGLASAGVTSMIPREGFATSDSGVQSDGSVVAKHSFGGWEKATTLNIKAAGWTQARKTDGTTERALVVWEIPAAGVAQQRSALAWIGGDPAITDLDMERATKIQPGRTPVDIQSNLNKATNTPPVEAKIGGGGAAGVVKPVVARWSGGGEMKKQASRTLSGTWYSKVKKIEETLTLRNDGTFRRVFVITIKGRSEDVSTGTYQISGDNYTLTGKVIQTTGSDLGRTFTYTFPLSQLANRKKLE